MKNKKIQELSMEELTTEMNFLRKWLDDNCMMKQLGEGQDMTPDDPSCSKKRKRCLNLQSEFRRRTTN